MSKELLILVVEDEYFLMLDLEQVLNDGGFAAETTSSGEEALRLFMQDTKKYKALITVVRLKGTIDGWNVARLMREEEPALPVIYVTGSNIEEWGSNRVPESILIPKPFHRLQLIRTVSKLLNIEAPRNT